MYFNNQSNMAPAGRASPAMSTTTYHSFNDIELMDPPSSPPTDSHIRPPLPSMEVNMDQSIPIIVKVQRKDSGYESQGATPRNSASYSRPMPPHRVSMLSNCGATGSSLHSRVSPVTRRSTGGQASKTYRPGSASHSPALYHFPSPDLVELAESDAELPSPPLPQTTHYWTSDSTRRLEYAAIDAASQGVKGWVRRHLVPDCFAGKEKHVAFDDDTGSVRRYRLDLEDDHEKFAACKNTRSQRKSRLFSWPLRVRTQNSETQ